MNDNGRIWQNLYGALSEAVLFDRALKEDEIAEVYEQHRASAAAAKRHTPPKIEGYPLWSGGRIPKTADARVLEGTEFHVIKPWEFEADGYRFLHGVALVWHKGRLYASFGHNKGGENTDTEEARGRYSDDGGKTWSDVFTIDAGEPGLAVSHGVFLSHQGRLWAFHGSYRGVMQGLHARAYVLNEVDGRWEKRGVVVEGGFWPTQAPQKMDDGNWIMAGMIVGSGNPAAVAISHGDDLLKWALVVIPKAPRTGTMWGESSVILHGRRVINIARYSAKALPLVSVSEDYGRTWTDAQPGNMPMATSKPYTGTLSTGQHYLVCTTTADSGSRRSPLTIALTRPGEERFSQVHVIRHAQFPDGPGESTPRAALAYPYAVEHDGKLYVGYSNNGGRGGRERIHWNNNSAEMAAIPIASLAASPPNWGIQDTTSKPPRSQTSSPTCTRQQGRRAARESPRGCSCARGIVRKNTCGLAHSPVYDLGGGVHRSHPLLSFGQYPEGTGRRQLHPHDDQWRKAGAVHPGRRRLHVDPGSRPEQERQPGQGPARAGIRDGCVAGNTHVGVLT